MTKDKFPKRVLDFFINNLNKVKHYNEDKNVAYEMNVFVPFKKDNDSQELTGYNLSFEMNMDRVKLKVNELKLKMSMQGIRWYPTESVIELMFFKDSFEKDTFYKDVQTFIEKYNDFLEEDKEKKAENIKNTILKAKLTTVDTLIDYVESISKEKDKKNYSEESFQQEPNIMIFGEEDDNSH